MTAVRAEIEELFAQTESIRWSQVRKVTASMSIMPLFYRMKLISLLRLIADAKQS
jgi:hypothetical protein